MKFIVTNWYWILLVAITLWVLFSWDLVREMAKAIIEDPIKGFISVVVHFPVRGIVTLIIIITLVLTVVLVALVGNYILSQAVSQGVPALQAATPFWQQFPTPVP